jgi:class 3 adenylate cyclase
MHTPLTAAPDQGGDSPRPSWSSAASVPVAQRETMETVAASDRQNARRRLAGSRPHATVMFADLSGFTALSERLDPEAATDLVNHCFAVLECIVEAHEGVVDKYIGDCIVAVWDLPDAAAGARQASRAACALRAAIAAFNRTVAPPSPLDVHIGIGTGPVIAGVIGGERSGAFTVVGDPVTLAQVIGELSPRGQIFADAATFALAHEGFAWLDLGPLTLPPLPQPVHGYELCTWHDDAALETVVAEALASAIEPSPTDPAATRRVRRGSERRQATVVFAEVAGFEPLAHTLTSERFTILLNRCFAALEPAVHGNGGVVDKYIGETIMALFGVPNAIEEAPKQALNAVIEMRQRLRRFAEEQGLAGELHLHVGVNTGLVIAGEMGGRRTRSFTVIGDTVNVAARLKAAAAADHAICVGRETYRHTDDAFDFADLPPLRLKGKELPVPAWGLLSERTRLHRTSAAGSASRAISSALVGRAQELAAIEQAVRRVTQGEGGIVTVVGDAGVGKSRLIAELLAMPLLERVQLLEGRSLSTGQGLSYHPFVDLIRRWAGISEEDAPRTAAARLARAVRDLMPEEFDDVLPLIARLMGLRLGEEAPARLQEIDGDALEALLFKSMREWLERLARRQPLVLLFEDLHWADQSSIKLMDSVLRLVESQPLLIVAVGRPNFPDTLGRIQEAARGAHAARLVDLPLQRLTDEHADALICNLLKTDQLPYALRALVVRKAEGNPFYIEEVIRSFIDSGAVRYRDGRFHVTDQIETIEVPGTIQEVIMTRVDRLDEETRHVLQVASVIGRNFYYRVLRAVLDHTDELDDALDQLTTTQLIIAHQSRRTAAVKRRLLHGELEYLFKHALAQEAVYGSLLQRTRRDLHRQVARTIEQLFADRLTDAYAMLAYHFSRAEELEKAEDYLFKAGEEAAHSAAANEALTFFREASRTYLQIHGEGGDPQRKAMLEKNIAQALLNTGALTESIDHFDRALEYLGERVPRSPAAVYLRFGTDLLAVLARLYLRPGRSRRRQVTEIERQVFEVMFLRARALTTSDPRRLFFDNIGGARRLNRVDPTRVDGSCGLYAGISALFAFTGFSFDVSARFLAVAKPLIRPGNRRDEFVYRNFWFIHHFLQGHWGDEHAIDEALVEEALRAGQLWDVNTYVGLLSDAKLRQGKFAAARDLIDWLAAISDSYGFAFAATNRDAMTMLLLLEERRLPEALEAAERYQRARHEDLLKVLGLGSKAKAQVLLGELEDAAATLAAAERIIARSRDLPPWHLSALAAARLHFAVAALERSGGAIAPGLRRDVHRHARQALAIAGKAATQRAEIYQLCGTASWLLASRRQALSWWARSLAAGAAMGARPEQARTRAVLARALDGATRVDGMTADEHLAAARAEFSALALPWDDGQLAAAAPARAA